MPITSGYKPSRLQFSPSQVFFDQQKELLKSFGFFPTTSIDLYVKYSFQLVEETYFIKGGEVISYDMDHEEQGHAMVYQVGLLNPLQVVSNSWSMDLKDATDRIKNGIFSYIKNFPFWQWGGFLFFVCLLGLAGKFGEVLLWINVIGIVLMLLFSMWRTGQYLFSFFKKSSKTYKGFSINYVQESDLGMLTDNLIAFFPELSGVYIEKIAYTGNCFYFYQTIHKDSKTFLKKDKPLTEDEKAELTQKTLNFLQTSPFLSLVTQA